MRVRLVAVGTRLPAFVTAGYEEYARRLPKATALELHEIPAGGGADGTRGGSAGAAGRARLREGERMLATLALWPGSYVVALEVTGRACDTAGLAAWWARRLQDGRDLAFLVGGPDGLAPACQARADERLSLSPLTLPHGLVRVVLAEQLYRVASLAQGHPYHRP
jgi:23S rRNA (pseudouridine1915-N3)-methyltransferase